jgi:hypothetical protein
VSVWLAADDPRTARTGAAILDDVEEFIGRFVAFPSEHDRVAYVLWLAHAHMIDGFETTPRIAFLSAEPECGKSRALEIGELLVPRPVHAVNVTPAYLFRKVGDIENRPTVLFDEIDTIFGPHAKEHEDLRGLLNSGHRRGAVAGRCIVRGNVVKTEEIPSFCAVALAGIGDLPDTIMTRSIIVRMRRRGPGEKVEPFRIRLNGPEGHALRDNVAAWTASIADAVRDVFPELPDVIEDRAAECWEPLITIADAAGGDWPDRARVAAVTSVTSNRGDREASLGVRLLADLREIFDTDKLSTFDILTRLIALDEAPWHSLKGEPLNALHLARMLRRYGVSSKTIRTGTTTIKGYVLADLHDPFARYLSWSQRNGVTDVTSETSCAICDLPMTVVESGQTTHPGCESP